MSLEQVVELVVVVDHHWVEGVAEAEVTRLLHRVEGEALEWEVEMGDLEPRLI